MFRISRCAALCHSIRATALVPPRAWPPPQPQKRYATKTVVPVEPFSLSEPANEPILAYTKGTAERKALVAELAAMCERCETVPIVIGDQELTGDAGVQKQTMPHQYNQTLATFSHASAEQLEKAIRTACEAQAKWDRTPWSERFAIWMRAADLMAGPYRAKLCAATMLGQGKTAIQAEIDAAAELIDFTRLNAFYAQEAMRWQPTSPTPQQTLNSLRLRGIGGFVAAISPFNFTAIGGNLAYTPALMGNAVLWKPSDAALLASWIVFQIMREAGVPPGVVNFVPADGPTFGDTITKAPSLAGLNFTGSVPTFARLWRQIGERIDCFANFPRLVGECGGKNFHFVHASANPCTVAAATLRSAFEYSGQKCSACSRLFVPASLWCGGSNSVRTELLGGRQRLSIGEPMDFNVFTGPVIDGTAYRRIRGYLAHARDTEANTILGGACYDCSVGWFVHPTIVQCADPLDKLMTEEIFGPILAVYVYKDEELEQTMELVVKSTKYALTGAVFAEDEQFLVQALEKFRMSAGNFYVNDKSTGAVVGQQPFGGGRMSGTNDKAGAPSYVLRWTSPQSVKETFEPLTQLLYPYMK